MLVATTDVAVKTSGFLKAAVSIGRDYCCLLQE